MPAIDQVVIHGGGCRKVCAGAAQLEDLEALLDAAGLGAAARTKTRTVLNRLWLEPRVDSVDYAERGVAIYKARRGDLQGQA